MNLTHWSFQVMTMCESVPHYTPVAKFIDGRYIQGSAGVFIACIPGDEQGFQVF